MDDRCQLVLFPGLGADARQWTPQKRAFPDLLTPPWIPPADDDTLATYSARLAETLPRGRPLVLGGSSFGGMIAWEMARHLHPLGVILIGSCRSPQAIHRGVRMVAPVFRALPVWAVRLGKPLAPLAAFVLRGLSAEQRRLCAAMFSKSDPRMVRWAVNAILGWRPSPAGAAPVFHIHGRRDGMNMANRVDADEIVPDAGHLLNLSHAAEVNDFLRSAVASVDGTAG